MRKLLSEQMGTVSLEIICATLALFALGFLLMRTRARRAGSSLTARHYIITGIFSLFLAVVLVLTLTPIGVDDGKCHSELYYPRLYAGWSWIQAFQMLQTPGTGGATSRAFAQLFFNIGLFIPIGLFTAGCLRWGLRASALAGFGLSLFIELSQLSGNWGLVPCAYRTFDVDDIINNTAGALIGALIVLVWRRIRHRMRYRHLPDHIG